MSPNSTSQVLVVEDNLMIRELLGTMLERMKLRVLSESDGKAGLRTAKSEVPDLILIDMRLPSLDGLDAVREMRRCPELSTIPIVALTGYSAVLREEEALEAGCNAFFPKPFDLAELSRKIDELLHVSRGGGSSRPIS